MNYKEEDEALLLDMVCESNEEVRNSLYEKYEKNVNVCNNFIGSIIY